MLDSFLLFSAEKSLQVQNPCSSTRYSAKFDHRTSLRLRRVSCSFLDPIDIFFDFSFKKFCWLKFTNSHFLALLIIWKTLLLLYHSRNPFLQVFALLQVLWSRLERFPVFLLLFLQFLFLCPPNINYKLRHVLLRNV